jgi:hypothetical protein
VIRPIRIFGTLAISGSVAALLALAGWSIPRALLAMTACLALAFSVNRRPTRPPRWPELRRAGWLVAAALMLAAISVDVPSGSGAFAFAIGEPELIVFAAAACGLSAVVGRIIRGIFADRDDRLLIGAVAGIVAFVVLFATSLPLAGVEWLYVFSILLGAALARANGNLRVP